MSLSSVKDKTPQKASLIRRPSVTFIQPVQLVGKKISSSQPAYFYVQSINKSEKCETQHSGGGSQVIISTTTTPASKPVPIASRRSSTFQLKRTNTTATSIPLVNLNIQSTSKSKVLPITIDHHQIIENTDFTTINEIAKTFSETINTEVNIPSGSDVKSLSFRYRTILENLLQLKNNFVRKTITQAIQQKLCSQTSDDLLNVIFRSFELILVSVNLEQVCLNVRLLKY